MPVVYVTGSLEQETTTKVAALIRSWGYGEVFDDWYAAGEGADRAWQAYEQGRGRNMREALYGRAAKHVYDFDMYHLSRAEVVVLAAPAGKSAHIEATWALMTGKSVILYFDKDPEKWDVLYRLLLDEGAKIVYGENELKGWFARE